MIEPTPRRELAARNSRAAAAVILARWLEHGGFPDREIQRVRADRAFVTELVYGAARRRRTLEWIAHGFLKHEPPPGVMACLFVGIYQLIFMDDVAAHAAVNETVEAAWRITGERFAPVVNGVLRNVGRRAEALRSQLKQQPLGIRESHPDLLVKRWTARFGPNNTEALCAWNNRRPRVVIRVNPLRVKATVYLRRLLDAGIAAEPHPDNPGRCLVLPGGCGVKDLPGFDDGLVVVQDPSAIHAVALLGPRPGERVLDACAAPGGKLSLMAEMMNGQGTLIAMDRHADRLPPLRENIARLGLAAEVVVGDARDAQLDGVLGAKPFDRILLDVPCSNTGVLSRRPDARWRFSLSRLTNLVDAQIAMLDNLAGRLSSGGSLVYSTCSLETEENEGLIARWLAARPGFRQVKTWSCFPPDSQTDGAFAALIRRDQESASTD
jgi:16S rRNA (cytosine967-C5)-methyltransferase